MVGRTKKKVGSVLKVGGSVLGWRQQINRDEYGFVAEKKRAWETRRMQRVMRGREGVVQVGNVL